MSDQDQGNAMELWTTKHNLTTCEIVDSEVWEILDWILRCLCRHGVTEVTMIYGYEWDVGSLQWREQLVDVATIHDRIKALEAEDCGCLGVDDLFLRVGDQIEIQFCHHAHLHLRYDQEGSPLISDLLAYFTETIGLAEK